MSNRHELANARRKARLAAESLQRIEALPRRRGERVRWRNGVIWTREGDDAWIPWSEHQPEDCPAQTYSSAHVASFAWERA